MAAKCATRFGFDKLAAQITGAHPMPDAVRASTETGRRLVGNWVMNVLTSDAPIHQMGRDIVAAGIKLVENMDFVSAVGNMTNAISERKRIEATEYMRPIQLALEASMDALGITERAERAKLAAQVGLYRDALHVRERSATFFLEKGKFEEVNTKDGRALAKEARNKRKAVMQQATEGKLTPEEYLRQLQDLADEYGISQDSAMLHGVALEEIEAKLAELENDPKIQKLYGDVKPYIDRAFARSLDLQKRSGRVPVGTINQVQARNWQHYTPLTKDSDLINLHTADFFDISPQALQVAGNELANNRVPMFVALHAMLDGAAKNYEENKVSQKMWTFAKEHGNKFGMKVHGGKDVYLLNDDGYSVNSGMQVIPDHTVPYFNEGKMYMVTLDNTPANKQLFLGLRNRYTSNYSAAQNPVDQAVSKTTFAAARLFTNANPQFWFNSLIRDPLSVISAVALDSRIKNKWEVLNAMAKSMAGDFNHMRALQYYITQHEQRDAIRLDDMNGRGILGVSKQGGINTAFAEWARDLAKHGGESSFNQSFKFQGAEDISGLSDEVPFDLGGSVGGVESAKLLGSVALHHTLRLTGDMVSAFDMQARVSAYKALVESGHNKTEAAALVREMMDFSQKSLKPTFLNTLVPFYRTSAAAAYKTVDMLLYDEAGNFAPNLPVLAGFIAIGMMAAVAGRGDQDDDGIYQGDKISLNAWMSKMPLGFDDKGNAISVPLPYGPAQVLVGLGLGMGRIRDGGASIGDVAGAYAIHVTKNISPLGWQSNNDAQADGADTLANTLIHANPFIGTAADLNANKNAFGSEIHNSGMFGVEPSEAYLDGRADTPAYLSDMAHWLFAGSAGVIDAHPETIQHLLEQYVPGVRFTNNNMARARRQELGSEDPNDWIGGWSATVGSVVTDKSPQFYAHNQYTKAMAQHEDIKQRSDLGYELTPEMVKYYQDTDHYYKLIGRVRAKMKGASDLEKYQLQIKVRELQGLLSRVAIQQTGKPNFDMPPLGDPLAK